MNDMTAVITPKSDQLNSDTLISGPLTIRITGVDIKPGSEQPVTISFEGDNGQPWKPCKSMSRVLVAAWGPDAKVYAGRSVTLYRDASVKWGGMEVGGIRVSHLSHMERDLMLALTATKGSRKPYTVKALKVEAPAAAQPDAAVEWARSFVAKVKACHDMDALAELTGDAEVIERRQALSTDRPKLAERINDAVSAALALFDPPAEG